MESPTADRPTRSPLAWAVLVTALLQAAAPAITIAGPGASPGGGSGAELLITPVGWAFSIWGVIYALAIAQAVVVLAGRGATSRRLQVDQLVLHLGAVAWIAMAAVDDSLLTALALTVMVAAAVDGALAAVRLRDGARWSRLLTRTAVGLYAGWVTAAFFLNLSTALVALDVTDPDSLAWQVAVLVVATAALLLVLVRTGGLVPYAVAGAWALVGITTTGLQEGTTTVVVTALAAAALVVLVTAGLKGVRAGRH